MKILFIADNSDNKEIKEEYDVVILLGDLDPEKIKWLKNVNKPKFGIYGNHCRGEYFNELNIKNLHCTNTNIGNVSIYGLEGCVKYKGSEKEYSQMEYYDFLKDFKSTDIFVSHCPPRGVNDNPYDSAHLGIEALVDKLPNIKLLVHGHTYPKNEWSKVNNTWILYVYGTKIIDLNNLPSREDLREAESYGGKEINTTILPFKKFWDKDND